MNDPQSAYPDQAKRLMNGSPRSRTVFMFSGQGTQYYTMGLDFYRRHPGFKRVLNRCDEIAKPFLGASLVKLLYEGEGKDAPFERLLHSNPALLAIQFSLAQVLREAGVRPDMALGYGLGEITASVVAGLVGLDDAFRLVIGMARLIEDKAPAAKMISVFAAPGSREAYPSMPADCWITAQNFANCYVATGLPDSVDRLKESLEASNTLWQKLPVTYGFHTRLLDLIASEFKAMCAGIPLRRSSIPIVTACRGWVLREPDEDYFWKIIRYPVEFDRAILGLLEMGDYVFVDASPSGALATYLGDILPPDSASVAVRIMNPFGLESDYLERLREPMGHPKGSRFP